ncbi:MAG: glycosyltransferase, partial [Lachnospiraceae bacterium]|nr:glycosyltransferase [Lachnospiraceae bacterium]
MRFTIIVVSLNAGEELKKTVDSVLTQTYKDYEILVKDGGSEDGSTELLPENERIRIITQPDCSIYDAMNQAVM